MASEQWAKAQTCRDLIEDKAWLKSLAVAPPPKPDENGAEVVARDYVVEVGGKRFDVKVHGEAMASAAPAVDGAGARPAPRRERRAGGGGGGGSDELHSPLQGNIFKVLVDKGAKVEEGALVCIIEAMKMENEITAHKAGVIADLPIAEGAAVSSGDLLAVIKSE
jgi:acetyl-CoA/propionyl-CoA carboxylase, biotin carboxylase, biotin carboxyl carrier protein